MYSNILVPVAEDEPRRTDAMLEIAGKLAVEGAKITVLHVIESVPGFVRSYIPEDALERVREDSKAMLSAVAARAPGVSGTTVVHGHGGQTIVEHAEAHGIDCIVLGSHRPEFQDVFFGSTAAYVVRHARCSVHVLRA